jgi:D-sedoheptulose 7-phosphate isomerase
MFDAYCQSAADLLVQTSRYMDAAKVEAAIQLLSGAANGNKALMLCGNGGSASDAMHISGELIGRFLKERRALKAICLSSNSAVLTAWSNDYSYDTVFARQVEAFAEPGAVLLGLSTSGNSANVVNAFETARSLGVSTIALTGQGGGMLAAVADVLLDVPSRHTPAIQQVHICIYHYLCEKVEERCMAA